MPGSINYTALLETLASATFRTLRSAQRAGLESYAQSYSATPDLAIELPTGAGKSLMALLICEAWRRENATVAVLTGNKTLAREMETHGHAPMDVQNVEEFQIDREEMVGRLRHERGSRNR
jgi:Rad3-related DNA helicase